MPKKITKTEIQPVVKPIIETIIDLTNNCLVCGRICDNPALNCAKGDKNQFKFCSLKCYNQDTDR